MGWGGGGRKFQTGELRGRFLGRLTEEEDKIEEKKNDGGV